MTDEKRDQDDVLAKKDQTTSSGRGLQQWGSDLAPDDAVGTAGSGTAERAARIANGQRKSMKREE